MSLSLNRSREAAEPRSRCRSLASAVSLSLCVEHHQVRRAQRHAGREADRRDGQPLHACRLGLRDLGARSPTRTRVLFLARARARTLALALTRGLTLIYIHIYIYIYIHQVDAGIELVDGESIAMI